MTIFEQKRCSVLSHCVLVLVLCAFGWSLVGCSTAQPGETMAEGHRRHKRILSTSQQQFMSDLDMVLLFDKPSKLSDRTVP